MKPNFEMEDELEQAKAERDYWKSLFTSLIENAPKPTLAVDHNENITPGAVALAARAKVRLRRLLTTIPQLNQIEWVLSDHLSQRE